MDIDPKLLSELTETFKIELDEQLQIMTDGLLYLETHKVHDSDFDKQIDSIFRVAHTIKGSAGSIGVKKVSEIAHQVESIFSAIKAKKIAVSSQLIDLCLETVDDFRDAMKSHMDKEPIAFDLKDLLSRLESAANALPAKKIKKHIKDKITQSPAETSHTDSTIRVSLDHLDQVSALMEEMQVNKIAIDEYYLELTKINKKIQQLSHLWKQTEFLVTHQFGNTIKDDLQKLFISHTDALTEVSYSTQQLNNDMLPRINDLSILSNNLLSEVRMLRLIPVSDFLRSFPRLVRDLANELNKKVELEIKGAEVKIDKVVLEGLKDPLLHLIRNAIDHGIEAPAVRKRKGKSETGLISIEVSDEGNQILFTISDDGAGMDAKNILTTAENKHLITKSEVEQISEESVFDLIFQPGFSTKEVVTDISGRGVGLDIVKENINSLKGNVELKSEPDKGTVFYLRVPLTLTSERGLMVSCSGQVFAIPTSHVEKVLILNTEEIITVSASAAIVLDGHTIPLRSLSDILALKASAAHANHLRSIVVIKKGRYMVALAVDEIMGEKEIVIKPLHAPIINLMYAAGGTLAGNGQVIVVLDANDLIDSAMNMKSSVSTIVHNDEFEKPKSRIQILVVDDSITTRTMEKNVLENKNYEVTLAVNGKEAWDILQKRKFSLLITDVSMPIMDGFTLTELVKKSDEFRDLPVIIVTSQDSAADKKRGIDVGANAYIVKNEFESDTLLKIVEQLV